ncbi:uncharacterized protein LOC143023987 [Oratosquilla oratoria]|uniref:uncharacterized protein LOC143023987 n=1 Tax=Oratosquilla oratoria TaxID=337810 RepID=UPI003F7762B3
MKLALLLCFLAASQAQVVVPYVGGVLPYAAGVPVVAHSPYRLHYPVRYVAPAVPVVKSAVVHPGYVAKTPGSTHIAPLPKGLAYASHHINLPETK